MPTSSPHRSRLDPALLELASGALGARSSRALLAWYQAHHRSLPWRPEAVDLRDPYRTWLSEIMLQQTRVETVVPYFHRFLARFPTVDALALAPLDDVLAVWSGLGYYSRARNLHAAARLVAAAGSFPDTLVGLRALPGVGAYVSGAVASIAFGLDAAAVDGNVERVLSRLFAYRGPRSGVHRLASAMLPSGQAGDFNQALMDLGSSVCTARSPSCPACPLETDCRALAAKRIDQFPLKKTRRSVPQRDALAVVLWRGQRVLLAR
ncbi:MAG: A/G-specific adenine glycosylase, partial [Oligoflexia bacterium]|nr:A/G-specific adenine glycosylase [Oligoflexia bacterium]